MNQALYAHMNNKRKRKKNKNKKKIKNMLLFYLVPALKFLPYLQDLESPYPGMDRQSLNRFGISKS
jgi:hypothetical protein